MNPFACITLGLLLACANVARAEVVAIAADHRISAELSVETRWSLDMPAPAGTRFQLVEPLPHGTLLQSDDVTSIFDARQRISGLVARRDLPAELTLHTHMQTSPVHTLPIASPAPSVVERARFEVPLHVTLPHARIVHALGIRMAAPMSRAARHQADQLLDGQSAHRRLGALYFHGDDGPLALRIDGTEHTRGSLRYLAVGLFVALCAAAFVARKWALKRMRRERDDAYLRRMLSPQEQKLVELEEGEEA